jgi:hypothetical protein
MMSWAPLWVLVVLFVGCAENPPAIEEEKTQEESSVTMESKAPADEEAAVASTDPTAVPSNDLPEPVPAWSYHHLRGKIGELPITMELSRLPASYELDGYRYHGFYRYDRVGGPIAVYGSVDPEGWLVLRESGSWQEEPHVFRGKWTEDDWQGEWMSGDGERQYPFVLSKAVDDGSVPFITRSIMDTFLVKPHWTASPQAVYQVDYIEPQADSNGLNQFLRQAICQGLMGDSLAERHRVLEAALVADKRSYFDDYRAEMIRLIQEGLVDTLGQDLFYSFSYEQSSSVFIYCNSPTILTLGYQTYYFTGGAHGNYATAVVTYDLQEQRVIPLDEVLAPGYQAILSMALEQAIRSKYKLAEGEELTEILFDDTVAPNDNFGLTEKGIFFVYPPYEIAPYAVGEIELYIPFTEIAEVVLPRWRERS